MKKLQQQHFKYK